MFSVKIVATLLAAAALAVAQGALQINTPTALYTCEPYQLTWSGSQGPYFVRALAGGTTSQVLETLVSNENVNSYTWNVNLAAGTSVTIGVTDSQGQSAYSAQVTVQEGSSTDCVGQAASGSASAASTGSSSLASSATAGAATTASSAASSASSAASTAASRASSAGQSAASSAASSTPSAQSGAGKNVISGLAGVAAVAALLV
ncbi:hypothetical protein JCM3774_006508 [Rhodotorula dairenensis]